MTDLGNSKGPAPTQVPAWLSQSQTDAAPASEAPQPIPAAEVKPEDIGSLAIEYRDGQPVIVASGGKFIPAELAVVDGSGKPRAAYRAFSAGRPVGPPLPGWQEGAMMSENHVVSF
ncbi:hypothetical protein ACWFRT_28550 [Streptomyces anulatus]